MGDPYDHHEHMRGLNLRHVNTGAGSSSQSDHTGSQSSRLQRSNSIEYVDNFQALTSRLSRQTTLTDVERARRKRGKHPGPIGSQAQQPRPRLQEDRSSRDMTHLVDPQHYGLPLTLQDYQDMHLYNAGDNCFMQQLGTNEVASYHSDLNVNYNQAAFTHPRMQQQLEEEHAGEDDIEQEAPSEMQSEIVLPPSSHGVITRVGPYLRPSRSEYKLTADPYIANLVLNEPRQSVYKILSDNQSTIILELLRSVRPYSARSIQNIFAKRLNAYHVWELLSGDEQRVKNAIELFFPSEKKKINTEFTPWMIGLTDAQRIQVIEELAEATDQPSDLLRENFLTHMIPPVVAIDLLNLTTDEERVAFAHLHGLYFKADTRATEWQRGLSKYQRESLFQRMTLYGLAYKHCLVILRRHSATPGYGKYLLRADAQQFGRIMADLKERYPQYWRYAGVNESTYE
ncbi:hypothetical protein CBS101457_000181 [Exobasidium rhododendri]|nr:hypothetical protein CBS101457_000181 [Exobasidium rhododendri]